RFPLPDALALIEARAGLEGVPEGPHGTVELCRARLHPENGEDAAVGLDEGDVQGGWHVLHVELRDDLVAEVEEEQAAMDLLRGRALKTAGLPIRSVRRPHSQGDSPGAYLNRDHLERHAGEGLAPARTLDVLGDGPSGQEEQRERGQRPQAARDHGRTSGESLASDGGAPAPRRPAARSPGSLASDGGAPAPRRPAARSPG